MSCDKTKLNRNRGIVKEAQPENNYRLSLNHARSVGATPQYLNYNVTKSGRASVQSVNPRGTDLFMRAEHAQS